MRTRFLLFNLLVVLAGLWLNGCKSPDSPEPNLPPMSFTVKATLSATSNDVALTWNRAKDPNGDLITYAVVVKDTLVRNLTDTTYTFQKGSYAITIIGKVIAKDSHGALTSAPFTVSVGNNPSSPETVRFVKFDDGRSLKNGLSWATAYDQTQLQTAINSLSVTGGQVWVAQGLYKPTTNVNDRNASFTMYSRVAIYGGFSTDTTLVDARNPSRFPTILSGDIDGDGTLDNNSFSVVKNRGGLIGINISTVDSTAILDGFTITGGNAVGDGGGISNETASPSFINCAITGNTAEAGGGIYNTYFSRPHFINCLIATNSAAYGGGMYNYGSAPRLINCVIRNNTAKTDGGGFYSSSAADPDLINCTITGNSAPLGGALSSRTYSGTDLINCILWNNGGVKAINNHMNVGEQPTYETYAYYCLIEAETIISRGSSNMKTTTSPFVSTNSLELLPRSLAIDGGSNGAYRQWIGPPIDFAGNSRIINQLIDIGAIESR